MWFSHDLSDYLCFIKNGIASLYKICKWQKGALSQSVGPFLHLKYPKYFEAFRFFISVPWLLPVHSASGTYMCHGGSDGHNFFYLTISCTVHKKKTCFDIKKCWFTYFFLYQNGFFFVNCASWCKKWISYNRCLFNNKKKLWPSEPPWHIYVPLALWTGKSHGTYMCHWHSRG